MESVGSFFLILLIFILFLAFCGYCYKNRTSIAQWLNPTYYACDDRKLRLKRIIENAQRDSERAVEDAKKELETIEKAEAETGEYPPPV